MMNPNAYAPPQMQAPQQQQPQQQQQFAPGWPPQQQQPSIMGSNQGPPPLSGGMNAPPPSGMMPTSQPPPSMATSTQSSMPPTSQGMLNGNYQQQLAASMGGLSVNPLKQQNALLPPTSFANTNASNMPPTSLQNTGMQASQPPLSNGPNAQQPPPPSMLSNNNNNYGPPPSSNGPTNPNAAKLPSSAPAMPQAVPGGTNLMTVNSANVPGLPHMPPQRSALPPMPGQMPTSGAGMPPTSMPGMPPMPVSSSAPTSSMPGMPPMPVSSGAPTSSMPGMPPMPIASNAPTSSMPGMPPMPVSSSAPTSSMQGMPQMPVSSNAPTSSMPGMPPMTTSSGAPPSSMPGMPPTPITQSSYPPQSLQQLPPRPGQMPGMPPQPQPFMPPTSNAAQLPMPPSSFNQPSMQATPGMPPMVSGYPQQTQQQQPGFPSQQTQPGFPPQPQPGFPPQMQQPGYPPQPQQQAGYPPQPMAPTGYPNPMMAPAHQQMPPRPGYNQQPGAPGGMYQQQPQQYQQQPPRRLDPDQMPNPIQVMIEDQRNNGGAFITNQAGRLPPLVTTKYIVQDQGNSSPRFVRSSLYCIPSTGDLLKNTALPFTLIVSPYASIAEGEYDPPIVDFGELGPIRCNRCKAYMSPNMQFIDAGRRFHCQMCKVTTEVPTEYFQHLDHTGQRVDKYERPELVLGTYEFHATKDYCRNNTPPEIPAFVFVIDVSYNAIKSGLVHLLCSHVKNVLKNLPIDQGQDKSKVRVGFITFNSTVHFYNIKSNLAQPQMMLVGDVQDMFMPLLDGFLCHPEESEALIDALMEQIPKMFVDTKETETVLYPAIQAGLEALKASNCAGKLLVFNSSLPIAEAPGKLKNRDDRKLLGTEKEKTVLTPQCTSYNTLGQECVQAGCSVDLFVFNNSYIDIATIGQVSRLSGGEVFKYTYFQAEIDGKRLIEDIIKNVSRPIAFDAVMRVRTSAGVRATDFYGHFFMSNTTDVELASVDSTKSVAIEIKHDDKLPPEECVYLQIALLYTSCSGQRRLRIFNLALTATVTIADVFKSCDLDAMMLFFAKQACFKLMELTPKAVKDNIIHRTAQILASYRKHCTSPTSAGQLILPECLKLLPLYVSCLLKNDAISGGSDMTLDDRSYVIQFLLTMDLNMSVNYLYPRLIPIHNVEPEDSELPMSIRCTHEKMQETGAYILENGVYMFVWLGQSLPQTFVQPLFGVQCTQQVNAERFAITGDTPLAQRVKDIIEMIMAERTRYMRVTCVRQNDKLESVFRHFLIEDRGTDGSASYVDFLCHMHKEIKDLLS